MRDAEPLRALLEHIALQVFFCPVDKRTLQKLSRAAQRKAYDAVLQIPPLERVIEFHAVTVIADDLFMLEMNKVCSGTHGGKVIFDVLPCFDRHVHAGEKMVIVVPARNGGAQQTQLAVDLRKMPPGDRLAVKERNTRLSGDRADMCKVKILDPCVHMDEKIGVFAVEKAQLLFKNFKVSVRNDKPCVAHEKHPFRRFHYTEHRRESQSARPCRRGEAH